MGALVERTAGGHMSNGPTSRGHWDDIVRITQLIVEPFPTVGDLPPLHKGLLSLSLFITSENHDGLHCALVSRLFFFFFFLRPEPTLPSSRRMSLSSCVECYVTTYIC